MYYIGCDQHKHYSQVMVKNKEGDILDQKKLYHNNREELIEYFSSLPKESTLLLEATGFDPWLTDLLQELGLNVKLAHPSKTKAIAEEKIMTDKISASVLADLLRANLVSEAYIASPEIRRQRFRMRYRQSLVHMRTMTKNKIHSILDRLGLLPPEVTDLFGTKGREYLNQLQIEPIYQNALKGYLGLIDTLADMIKGIDNQIRKEVKIDPQLKILTTIPGIGVVLSCLILAEIGDIKRFLSSSRLASYAGMVPSLHQSGMSNYSGHITKQGNKYLRWAFVEAAHRAIHLDPYLGSHYAKVRAKKGSSVAIIAIAHRLLIYTIRCLQRTNPIGTGRLWGEPVKRLALLCCIHKGCKFDWAAPGESQSCPGYL